MAKDFLPARVPSASREDRQGAASQVWMRISAFLSLKSPNTQKTYSGVLQEWCDFLGVTAGTPESTAALLGATDMHAIAYRKWLERKPGEMPRMLRKSAPMKTSVKLPSAARVRAQKKDGLDHTQSNATIWKKFAALRRIYRVLIAYDLGVTHNPFDTDRVPPPPKESGRKRPTEMIEFDLVKEILNAPDLEQPKGLRDRALLGVLFGGGLRRSEVVKLRIADVKRTPTGTTFLTLRATKARRDAEQAVPGWAAEMLRDLIMQRKAEGASDADYLFISYRGRGGAVPTAHPISDNGLYRLFKSYCMRVGAGAFMTPHSARATAITKLLAEGISHRLVQEFSRHASIQMVELYDKRRMSVDENPAKELKF